MISTQPTSWPVLNYESYHSTIETVHLWTQIIGKIRLRLTPWINHSWHVTLFVSSRGLTTGAIPYGNGSFQIEFDFINHLLNITSNDGKSEVVALRPRSVASFYNEVFDRLKQMGIEVKIHGAPNEMEVAIPFAEDDRERVYDGEQINAYWKALVNIDHIFTIFRSRYTGKSSPSHFFWGAFDLAVTRFSGRKAPVHPGGAPNMPDDVMQESYSHEVSSCGFWPGSEQFPEPCFYAYCYPTPDTFAGSKVQPDAAFYSEEMGEYFLKYQDVKNSNNPNKTLLEFIQSTYEAAANTGDWNRSELETDLSRFDKSGLWNL